MDSRRRQKCDRSNHQIKKTGDPHDQFQAYPLKQHIEIEPEKSVNIPEENPGTRVGNISVNIEGVEMIGQVEPAEGESDCIFLRDLEITRDATVKREEFRESF